jgi:flagellar hook-basal body complex protein FliE
MIDRLGSVGPAGAPLLPPQAPAVGPAEGERSFKDILKDSIENVNRLQREADGVLARHARGEATQDEVMIAFKKSQIAFEALLQVRNKLVAAFEEIQRMRI